jgi:hypothetical protein
VAGFFPKPYKYNRLACIPYNLCENSIVCADRACKELCDAFEFRAVVSGKLLIYNRNYLGTRGAWR